MASSQQPEFLLIEGQRHLEQQGVYMPPWQQPQGAAVTFEELLLSRAKALSGSALADALQAEEKRYKAFLLALVAITGVFAAISTVQLMTSLNQHSSNVILLLVLLLGVNIVSMFAWMFSFVIANKTDVGWLRFVIEQLLGKKITTVLTPYRIAARNALLALRTHPNMLAWEISLIQHSIWVAIMLLTLLAMWFMLAFNQYDFIWETTVLEPTWFINIVASLAWLPDGLGIAVPDQQLVEQSRLGAVIENPDSARKVWANLLLASLILYGVLPRLLLWLTAYVQRNKHVRTIRPNLNQAYYVVLRQQLFPGHSPADVLDADNEPTLPSSSAHDAAEQWPTDPCVMIGLEFVPSKFPPPIQQQAKLGAVDTLGNIVDRSSEKTYLHQWQNHNNIGLLLVVDNSAMPDRGFGRYLGQFIHAKPDSKCWLILWDMPKNRLKEWQHLAIQQGIPLDRVLSCKGVTDD